MSKVELLKKNISELSCNKFVMSKIIIFIHILLCMFVWNEVNNNKIDIIHQIFSFVSFLLLFISYLVFLVYKDRVIIIRYCVATIIICSFIVMDKYNFYTVSEYEILIRFSIQVLIIFFVQDVGVSILIQQDIKVLLKRIFYTIWILGTFLIFINEIVALNVLRASDIFQEAYPILIVVIKFKQLIKYNKNAFYGMLIIFFINVLCLYMSIYHYDLIKSYDVYIKLLFISIFFTLVIIRLMYKQKIIDESNIKLKASKSGIMGAVLIIFYLFMKQNKIYEIIIFIYLYCILIKEIELYLYFKAISYEDACTVCKNNKKDLFALTIRNSIKSYKAEEIYREQVADFLHDDILQDIIFMKKELLDRYDLSSKSDIIKSTDIMIRKIRGKISLYRPNLKETFTLKENYYDLINYLTSRNPKSSILIDFNCDDDIFLLSPYDVLLYRILHEVVTNIYKHSKGDFSEINLKISSNTIYLEVNNYGDSEFSINEYNVEHKGGLKIVKRELERFNGKIEIKSYNNICGKNIESVVNILITVPVQGGMVYENFVDRRS